MQENELKFSPQAEKEYDLLHDKLAAIASLATEMLIQCKVEHLEKSAVMHDEMEKMLDRFEAEHIYRIDKGNCRPQVGILYLDMLAEFRKISRHLQNISDRAEMFYGNFAVEQKNI